MAGAVYTGVQILTGVLFLLTRDSHDVGYYPSNGMVTILSSTTAAPAAYIPLNANVAAVAKLGQV